MNRKWRGWIVPVVFWTFPFTEVTADVLKVRPPEESTQKSRGKSQWLGVFCSRSMVIAKLYELPLPFAAIS